MIKQRIITKEEAIKLCNSGFWKDLSYVERFEFQFYTDKMCMPFNVFHEAAEKALGRPVWTREFAFPDLLEKEFYKEKEPPSFEEILNLIPADKRIIIATQEGGGGDEGC